MGLLLVFIVDVSESMGNQIEPSNSGGYGAGLTALDLAKAAVEQIIKPRKAKLCDARPEFRERHFLLTTEEGPGSIRASWNDDPSKFQEQLKMLAPVRGKPTSLAGALSTAFAILNQFRMQYGVDNYGQGRLPWRLEPGACVLLTDGEKLQPEAKPLTLTCPNTLGSELTREPYRWDQRLFSLVMQGSVSSGASTGVLRTLTESTGGWYSVSHSYTTLSVSAKFVAHKLNILGPVVIFAPDPSEQVNAPATPGCGNPVVSTNPQGTSPTSSGLTANGAMGQQLPQQQQLLPPGQGGSPVQPPTPSTLPSLSQTSSSHVPHPAGVRAVLCLRGNTIGGTWPIPESFWLERSMDLLPRREAQPTLYYRRLSVDSNDPALTCLELVERLGIVSDCYDLDWSGPPLKMSRAARWPVYVWDSSRLKGRGEPIGYLQAASVVGRAVLVLLPYNYPRLIPLIKQAVDAGSAQGNLNNLPVKWRPEFNQYLGSLPPYYFAPLKRALRKLGVASQVQEVKGGGLSQVTMRRLQRYGEMAQEEYQRLDVIVNKDDSQWRRATESAGGGKSGEGIQAPAPVERGFDLGGLDLVSAWESTRQRLFGEGGLTVMGLHIRGVEGRNGVCAKNGQRHQARACLLTEAGVGASLMPSRPVLDMGYYHHKLARSELPRDPWSDPEPDEDTLEGIMRRRLNVDFGNPFHPQSRVRGALSGPRLIVDEAADEARVLSPQLVGDDLNALNDDSGVDGSDKEAAALTENGDGSGAASTSQPSKKRQRLTELPSLPIHKKIRRRASNHWQPPPPPDLTAVPQAAAVVQMENAPPTPIPPPPRPDHLLAPLPVTKPAPVTAPAPIYPTNEPTNPPAAASTPIQHDQEVEEGEEPEPKRLRIVTSTTGRGSAGSVPSSPSAPHTPNGYSSSLRSPRDGGPTSPSPPSPRPSSIPGHPQDSPGTRPSPLQRPPGVDEAGISRLPRKPSFGGGVGLGGGSPVPGYGSGGGLAGPQPMPGAGPPAVAPQAQAPSVPPNLAKPNKDGWMPAFSKRENRPYYYNITTKQSVWGTPPGCIPLEQVYKDFFAQAGSGIGGGGSTSGTTQGGGGGGS